MFVPGLKFRTLLVCFAVIGLASVAVAQISASFQIPIMGYLFDTTRSIRPIAGIAGSSRIETSLAIQQSLESVTFLPDQRHAIVGSPDYSEAVVLDLREFVSLPIKGAPSSISEIRISPSGSAAGLYYSAPNKLVIVAGLPASPVIRATIDLSFTRDPLKRFAVSDDASTALLDFLSDDHDTLYSWSSSSGSRYAATASRVSDMTFAGEDAVYVDSAVDQAVLIRNVREQAVPVLIADSGDGLSHPSAVFFSNRAEIYVGDSAGGIFVLDTSGHILRRARCSCSITTLSPLASSALRLTDRLDQPIFIIDGSESDRILFIPALSAQARQGSVE